MNINPDWTAHWTKPVFETELAPTKFKGPGVYVTNQGTDKEEFLVVSAMERTSSEAWHAALKHDQEVFEVAVYNRPFHTTVLSVWGTVPTRE